ncbi:MAG: hypothetical protein US22_C0035G0005 [candidate division TM6 bacterium GW2011_GWF2_36_6]|nr:MAG: hypothetical protein US22_C0035G0005 [candidate division TM6 bacterium GW2011_GWF2_36_6]
MGGIGAIDGSIRGAKRWYLAAKNNVKSWFTKPTAPGFEFTKTEWPNEKWLLKFKHLDRISTYFNKLQEEYHNAAIADKSNIIEILEVVKQ